MFTRTAIVAVVAAASFVIAGAQAIGGDDNQPETSVIGLGQQIATSAVMHTSTQRPAGTLVISR